MSRSGNTLIRWAWLVVPGLLALVVLAASAAGPLPAAADTGGADSQALQPLQDQRRTGLSILARLQRNHYRDLEIDDDLSRQVLESYLETLDPSRLHFRQSDLAEFNNYKDSLDEALRRGDLGPAFAIYNRYRQRQQEHLKANLAYLEAGLDKLDFDKDESILIDRSEAPWPRDAQVQQDLWRKYLKNDVLALKLADKNLPDITKTLTRRYENQLHRLGQVNSEDVFETYINSFASNYDPHTNYLPPRDSENFDINMSLSLEGIGAVLQLDNAYTKVFRLVPAGPADKSGLLHPGDRIVGVGQGKDEPITDVVGWRLDEVVDLIRGPKGTVVRLEIIPADTMDETRTQTISITRNEVKLEEQSAQKQIHTLEQDGEEHRIGVISIPAFYVDFKGLQAGDPNYRSTTRDVHRLLNELREEDIDGLVIDLRNNGGGSLQEANSLIGLFIETGPTVQIRDAESNVDVLGDDDPGIAYTGPLAVLVNRLSASASEIFAGAIQDYGRGIVLGTRTFGKGTVQSLSPMDAGSLKFTLAKFYRISGGSTQNKGIIPDIEFPNLYSEEQLGESALSNALPWDSIPATRHSYNTNISPLVSDLRDQHESRARNNPDFRYLREQSLWLKEQRERKTLSLNEEERRAQRKQARQFELQLENQRRRAKGLEPLEKLTEEDELEQPLARAPGRDEDEDDEPDALVTESGRILIDLINLGTQVVKS